VNRKAWSFAVALAAAVALVAPATAFAQGGAKAMILELKSLLSRLELGEDQWSRLDALLDSAAEEITRARADLEIEKAKLTRLLMDKSPDMNEVRSVVRTSLEIEYRVRMAQIERNIQARAIVGEDNWALLVRASAILRPMMREGRIDGELEGAFKGEPKALRALKLVVRLFW
jgi:Spy/CpxP family protein refolding chaperone